MNIISVKKHPFVVKNLFTTIISILTIKIRVFLGCSIEHPNQKSTGSTAEVYKIEEAAKTFDTRDLVNKVGTSDAPNPLVNPDVKIEAIVDPANEGIDTNLYGMDSVSPFYVKAVSLTISFLTISNYNHLVFLDPAKEDP